MCKPFPPPLVRGGVFLVGSDTKYRDIADGNVCQPSVHSVPTAESDTKYRDIADGNLTLLDTYRGSALTSDTKYRDIADGNSAGSGRGALLLPGQIPSTAI